MPTGIYEHKKGYRRPPFSKKWKENLSKGSIGKKSSYGFFGKYHTKETKRKMSKAQKGKVRTLEMRKKYSEAKMGDKNPIWKGDNVGCAGVHAWIRRRLGSPYQCSFCGASAQEKKLWWASKFHSYKRNLKDWISLCVSCHKKYDKEYKGYLNR